MSTQIQDSVITALISNLRTLRSDRGWFKETPLIQLYEAQMNDRVRIYHNWELLFSMLNMLERIPKKYIDSTPRLRAAILFHCIDYVPGRNANDEESAIFAGRFYRGTNLAEIANLIRATRLRFPFEHLEGDCALMRDLYLMNLGSNRLTFITNTFRLCRELIVADVCSIENVFEYLSRFFSKIFTESKERGGIFKTDFFSRNFEAIAKDNLRSALALTF